MRVAIQLSSALLVVIGLILAGRGLAEGRWFEVLVGVLFLGAGGGRLYLERQR